MTFKRPELEDRENILSYFRKKKSRSCLRTFVNVFLWARLYGVEFAEYQGVLLFKSKKDDWKFAYPAGDDGDVKRAIEALLEEASDAGGHLSFYGVTEEDAARLAEWFPGKFEVEYKRDSADYVYETEKLASLAGKKLHSKKNHVNKFKALHEGRWRYETLTKEDLEECFQMALKWRNLNGCEENEEKNAEMNVTMNSLRLFEELGLTGGILRVDEEIVAFTLGEPVCDDTFVVHIEKAYSHVEGAYTMINQQFVEHELLGRYLYVNREEDMGVEGLRKAKLSYRPVFMVERGVAKAQ